MRLARSLLIAVLITPAALPAAAAPGEDLSGFLGAFDTTCVGSPAFTRYMFSLGDKYTIAGDRKRKVAVPADFKDSLGREKVTDNGSYVAVSVPLNGTYRGLPLSGLYFELGHETEHYEAAIVFDASVEEVRRTLGGSVARARKSLRRRTYSGYGIDVRILPEGRRAKYACMIE